MNAIQNFKAFFHVNPSASTKVEPQKPGTSTSCIKADTFVPSPQATRTALQKHVDFFDRNGDHKITVAETKEGLQALGIGKIRAAVTAFAINAGLGVKTSGWSSPLTVDTERIHQGKHDSDTDIYDQQGQFSSDKFNALFSQYDLDQDGALSKEEFLNFRQRNKESFAGGLASKAEFNLLLELAGQNQTIAEKQTQVIPKETMQAFYDGTLFYTLAGEKAPF